MASRHQLAESLFLAEFFRHFPVPLPNPSMFERDRFEQDCLHHQAFQALSGFATLLLRQIFGRHSDKPAGFVRSARRF
jgi:hypothetical protein